MMPGIVAEIFGWCGGFTVLLAYALITLRTTTCERLFQSLNLAGALMLAVNSASHEAWPSVVVNAIWIAIGTAALIRANRSKNAIELSAR